MQSEKEEIEKIMLEKLEIEARLKSAGGQDLNYLLELCADLEEIIDDFSEISGKKGKIEHAAFYTKVKFSRKIRRKAKDLGRFEQEIIHQFDLKHISLEHGKKMAEVVKLLKSNDIEKAKREAEAFHKLLEMSEQLKLINEMALKKRAQTERAKRFVERQLLDLEWLEKEPAPDLEKTGRHEQRMQLLETLGKIRLSHIHAFQSMPLVELLKKMHDEKLEQLGFPAISAEDARGLTSFLHKSGLELKSAEQLIELAELSPQKLKYLFIDLIGFKEQVAWRRAFLERIAHLHASDFLAIDSSAAPALAYLSEHSEEARKSAARMAELEKTAEEDKKEWERTNQIELKKTELAGVQKSALIKSLQELEALENILAGKARTGPPTQEPKKEGFLGALLGFFRGN